MNSKIDDIKGSRIFILKLKCTTELRIRARVSS